ncbi:MAG TPA: hypothetical protein DDW51_18535, partial [Cyanobacteria bacterium UBA11367]|nr:hypothetical protein [Cyanobacteria bacterium UBA11367]
GSRGAGEVGRRFDDFFPKLKISGLNGQQLRKSGCPSGKKEKKGEKEDKKHFFFSPPSPH